jgi:PadR family transcriptional regulator, regulatory protein PadR
MGDDEMSDIDRYLPLNPLEFSILLLLAEEGSAYGYGIVKGIARSSRGGVRLAPGNLYQVLDRLIARGWIREVPADPAADARRRYYGLTKAGQRALAAEAGRLRALLPALDRLNLAPGGRA